MTGTYAQQMAAGGSYSIKNDPVALASYQASTFTPTPAQASASGTPIASAPVSSTPTASVTPKGMSVTLGNGQQVFVDNQGNFTDTQGNALTGTQIAGAKAGTGTIAGSATPIAPPPVTPITNPLLPPNANGTPTPIVATAPTAVSDYSNSIANTLAAQNAQLTQAYQQQQANYQTQIDAANQAAADAKSMAESGLASENSTIQQETAQKAQALQIEQQQYNDNYNAIAGLAAQATALVTTAQQLTDQMRSTTGLASIMNPRISQTAADLTAQLAVINGAVNIYNGQIGAAQNQLKSATDAITSIYSDQLSYYQNVVSFYSDQQKSDISQVASLSKTQQTYIDAQISQLQDQIKSTQTTADYISKAMVDPATALAFAKAGVTLNMTIPQVSAAVATYQQSQTIQSANDAMTKAGYSLSPIAGAKNGTYKDQYGKTWYKALTTSEVPNTTPTATEGSDLADAKTFALANPNASFAEMKQVFLSKHPSSSAAWDAFFPDGMPTTPAPAKSGLFGLGFLGL
jgi:hypothetical protein